MTDDFRASLEKINDVLKREPTVKSFVGACRYLGAPEVKTVAEAIAILKEKPDSTSTLILKFSGVSPEQRQAMVKEIQDFQASLRKPKSEV